MAAPHDATHVPDMPVAPAMPRAIEVASTDDVRLAAYDTRGEPGGEALGGDPEVLLAHANGFCAAVYAPLVQALGDHRCVSYDARAHGHSTRGSADMSWEGHRDDVLAVHDAMGMVHPVGVSHSMGGAALLLAEQLRPGTFSALWLFEPIVFPGEFTEGSGGSGENPMEQAALRRRSHFESREDAFANFAGKPPMSELCHECLAAYVTYGFHPAPDDGSDGGFVLACSPEDEAAGYRMGSRHRAWQHLSEVTCPVVVLRGNDAVPTAATLAPLIASELPDGRVEAHDELGHFGPLENPGAMARSVLDLIASLPE